MISNNSNNVLGSTVSAYQISNSGSNASTKMSGSFFERLSMQMEGWGRALASNEQLTSGEITAIGNMVAGNQASIDATGADAGTVLYSGSAAALKVQIETSQLSMEIQASWGIIQNINSLIDKASQLLSS